MKTDEIENTVAVPTHQKAADDTRHANVVKTQPSQLRVTRMKQGTLMLAQETHLRLA
jgi:hypothetical protein